MTSGSKIFPGVLAGSAIGVLSSLPFVNLANCCCVWIVGGGMLASYLYQQNQDEPITVSDSLTVGAIAGVTGAVVGLLVSIPIQFITAPVFQRFALRILESSRDVPQELRDALENVSVSGVGLVLSFFFSLIVYGFLVPAGALVGGLMFQKSPLVVAPTAPSTSTADLGVLPAPPPLPVPTTVPIVTAEQPIEPARTEELTPPGRGGDDDLPPSSAPPTQPPPSE